MKLNKKLHLGLIFILIISSIAYALDLNWNSIFDASISFKELQGFLTSVFILLIVIIGFYYKPEKTD
jgi:hypothetical protein